MSPRGQSVADGLAGALNNMCPAAHYYGAGNILSAVPPLFGNAWFVDRTSGSNSNTGTAWDQAFETIQKAVDEALSFDTIYVAPAIADYSEAVVTRDANATRVQNYCRIIGTRRGGSFTHQPYWVSGAAASPCLTLNAVGWTIHGFKFEPSLSAYAIVANMQADRAGQIAIRTLIDGCTFVDLASTCLGGIDLRGAPWECSVTNCVFMFIQNAGGTAIAIGSTSTGFALAYRCLFRGNTFFDNDNCIHFGIAGRGINGSLFIGNVFGGDSFDGAMTEKLNLGEDTAGGGNIVMGNCFGGTYSNAGGYDASGGVGGEDDWGGNFANVTGGLTGGSGAAATHPA